jgi:MoaA/NifB/PqqE/SkfB family radical SAM enzyme
VIVFQISVPLTVVALNNNIRYLWKLNLPVFAFEELKTVHLEITNMCQADCPMCARNYHGGQNNPLIVNTNWTIGEFKTIFNQEVLSKLETIYFCGNFGDPILNSDLMEMCSYLKDTNPEIRVHIHTNGSARHADWWKELVNALPVDHNVVFALDGLEDTHSIYRIGTDFNKIIDNARSFIDAGGTAEWSFIEFKHNEHQIDLARNLSEDLGFKRFTLKNSIRFLVEPRYKVVDRQGTVTHYIEPPSGNKMSFISKHVIKSYKTTIMSLEIKCKVQERKEIYIDSYKNILPCCWLSSIPYTQYDTTHFNPILRKTIKQQYQDLVDDLGGIQKLNALTVGIKSVLTSRKWQTVWKKYWNEKKLIMCARTCGVNSEISKPSDQVIESLSIR